MRPLLRRKPRDPTKERIRASDQPRSTGNLRQRRDAQRMTPQMNALPPGPRGAILQTVLFARDSYSYLARCARRYGDPFTLPLLLGPAVVTGDPEGVKEIFS